jgi:hypothetical protein
MLPIADSALAGHSSLACFSAAGFWADDPRLATCKYLQFSVESRNLLFAEGFSVRALGKNPPLINVIDPWL